MAPYGLLWRVPLATECLLWLWYTAQEQWWPQLYQQNSIGTSLPHYWETSNWSCESWRQCFDVIWSVSRVSQKQVPYKHKTHTMTLLFPACNVSAQSCVRTLFKTLHQLLQAQLFQSPVRGCPQGRLRAAATAFLLRWGKGDTARGLLRQRPLQRGAPQARMHTASPPPRPLPRGPPFAERPARLPGLSLPALRMCCRRGSVSLHFVSISFPHLPCAASSGEEAAAAATAGAGRAFSSAPGSLRWLLPPSPLPLPVPSALGCPPSSLFPQAGCSGSPLGSPWHGFYVLGISPHCLWRQPGAGCRRWQPAASPLLPCLLLTAGRGSSLSDKCSGLRQIKCILAPQQSTPRHCSSLVMLESRSLASPLNLT